MVRQQGEQQRRRGSKRGQAGKLAELRARRDELDAAMVERRKAEDVALERYVAAEAKVRAVYDAAAKKVADLERQIATVNEKAQADAADLEAAQAAALLELHELGRSADELAQLTGIGVKRVRSMIRGVRSTKKNPPGGALRPAESATESAVPASAGPSSNPSGASQS